MLRNELPALLQDRSLSVATVLTLNSIILFVAPSLLFPRYTTYSLLQIYNIVQYQNFFVSHHKHSKFLTRILYHSVPYSSFPPPPFGVARAERTTKNLPTPNQLKCSLRFASIMLLDQATYEVTFRQQLMRSSHRGWTGRLVKRSFVNSLTATCNWMGWMRCRQRTGAMLMNNIIVGFVFVGVWLGVWTGVALKKMTSRW